MTKPPARDAVSNVTLTPPLTAFPNTPALVGRAALAVALGLAGCDSPTPEPRPPALKSDAGATDTIINPPMPPMPPMPPVTGGDGGSQSEGGAQNDGATPNDGAFQDGGAGRDGFVNDASTSPDGGPFFRDADGLQDIGKSLLDTGPGLDSNLPDIFGAPDAGPLQRD